MSVSSTSGSPLITFTDLTGFDTSKIVSALVGVASEPITLLQDEVTADQEKVAAWTDVGTQLTSLSTAVGDLKLQANMTGKTVASSDTSVATATATADAVTGTYTVTVNNPATATTAKSTGALAVPAATGTMVSALATPVTYGTFTINGVQVDLSGGTAGQTDTTDSLGQVVTDINNTAGINVTAALNSANQIVLTSTNGQAIQIGSQGDTSNFLAAANLLAAPSVSSGSQYTATSTSGLTKINTGATLDNAGFATALTSTTSGSFTINGVSISYNTTKDTLNNIISRINSAGAGVTATYDAVDDQLQLTATNTGSQSISLQDTSGNLLQALELPGATNASGGSEVAGSQTLGQNASFTISGVNGGNPIYSTSNQVTGALSDVTLNLAGTGTTTLTVGQDTSTAISTVNAFVKAYNAANEAINGYLAVPSSGSTTKGALEGDSDLENIQESLFTSTFAQVSGQPANYSSLAQIGITADQSTGDLVVDSSKLQAAVDADPQAVYTLFNNATNGVATTLSNLINGNSTTKTPGYLTPASSVAGKGGQIATEEKSYNHEITDLNSNITEMQQRVDLYQSELKQEYANMETQLSELQSTSSYLSSFVSSLNSSSSSSSSSSSTS